MVTNFNSMKKLLLLLPLSLIGLCFVPFGNKKNILKTEEIKWYTFKEAQELNKKIRKNF